jgi:hypothetical protein
LQTDRNNKVTPPKLCRVLNLLGGESIGGGNDRLIWLPSSHRLDEQTQYAVTVHLSLSGRKYTIGTEYNSRGEIIKQTYPPPACCGTMCAASSSPAGDTFSGRSCAALRASTTKNLGRKIERRKIALMSRALTSDEAVGHFGITMLRRSLPAPGNSRNQITSNGLRRHHRPLVGMERWSRCVACTGHHPTSTSDAVMRALWYSCWFRLGSHVDKPHGNLFASRNDDCDG